MSKKKYNCRKRYSKNKRYTKRKKKTPKKRGGSGKGLITGITDREYDEYMRSRPPSSHINVLNRIYGGDANAINKSNLQNINFRKDETSLEYEVRMKQIMDSQPKLILISGHGRKLPDFTLIPRNHELYLATGGGEAVVIANSDSMKFGENTYIRCYTGIIQNYYIDFGYIWIFDRKVYAISGGVYPITIKIYRGDIDENIFFDLLREETVGPDKQVKELPLDDYNECLVEDEEDYCEKLFEMLLDKHQRAGIMDINLVEKFIKTRRMFKLSQVLKHIEVSDEGQRLKKIFGLFCRSGDLPTLDIDIFKKCNHPELPKLTDEYFGSITYEGASLTRQSSLASKNKVQDFWNVYDKVIENKDRALFSETIKQLIELVRIKIEDESGIDPKGKFEFSRLQRGINLSPENICLIFQCDYYLMIKGI